MRTGSFATDASDRPWARGTKSYPIPGTAFSLHGGECDRAGDSWALRIQLLRPNRGRGVALGHPRLAMVDGLRPACWRGVPPGPKRIYGRDDVRARCRYPLRRYFDPADRRWSLRSGSLRWPLAPIRIARVTPARMAVSGDIAVRRVV